ARNWLHNCQNQHSTCNLEPQQWCPLRLLRIEEATTEMNVRLVQCTSEHPTGEYFALSHRWGPCDIVTLRSRNIASFEAQIPSNSLPETFLDAARVTLGLGYNYLWIDSLCIIQDSEEDWLHEASTMKDVYQNAMMTI
ncbi:hypothetical protein BU23DRAFT_434905, partial [Bimuria novae-zelandiae CBS 107.79]